MRRPTQVLALMSVLVFGWAAGAAAQGSYPSQPIKMYVGNVAGSSSDTIGRVFATSLSQVLGQQIIIMNQPGAGGTIAADIVARAKPDGYTIKLTSTQAHGISPHIYPKAKYKPLEDFVPITMLAKTENALVVAPQQPFKTVKDIIDYAKKNPGKLNMANAGPGSQSHLAGAIFANMAGIEVLHVPYKGAASVTAVIGNQTELTLTPAPAVVGHVKAGRLRGIAVGGAKRSAVLPDLPTIDEAGVKGFNTSGWTGLVAPKGTPPEVVAKIRDAVLKVVADPKTKEALDRVGGEAWTTTPDEMWDFVKKELEIYGKAVKMAGVKAR
jgi:tripartite-type tricarboxylate transporter receptor subunit TctC